MHSEFHIVFYYRSSVGVGFIIFYAQYFAAKYLFVRKDSALINNGYVQYYMWENFGVGKIWQIVRITNFLLTD